MNRYLNWVGSSPAYVSNHNFCVQTKYLCPITVYVSDQKYLCPIKIYVSNQKIIVNSSQAKIIFIESKRVLYAW